MHNFKSMRDAFGKMKVGQTATINGNKVKRLSVQKWEVDGVIAGRYEAQEKAREVR